MNTKIIMNANAPKMNCKKSKIKMEKLIGEDRRIPNKDKKILLEALNGDIWKFDRADFILNQRISKRERLADWLCDHTYLRIPVLASSMIGFISLNLAKLPFAALGAGIGLALMSSAIPIGFDYFHDRLKNTNSSIKHTKNSVKFIMEQCEKRNQGG